MKVSPWNFRKAKVALCFIVCLFLIFENPFHNYQLFLSASRGFSLPLCVEGKSEPKNTEEEKHVSSTCHGIYTLPFFCHPNVTGQHINV